MRPSGSPGRPSDGLCASCRASVSPFAKVPEEPDASVDGGHSTAQSDRNDGVHASPSVLAKWKAIEMLKVLQGRRHTFQDDGMM